MMDAMLMEDQNHIMIPRRARIDTKGPPEGVQRLTRHLAHQLH